MESSSHFSECIVYTEENKDEKENPHMKKQTVIILILCILVAAVIALSAFGVIGPQGSLAGYSHGEAPPTVSPPNTLPDIDTPWDQSLPTTP